ncbi:TetR-like C-terminal domain-containing protein [Paenibacillus sp. PL91]|uniref:TetR-like C-terminal domain-containing protein n=1 Tax=Paenibacillus sp. PL91 TaxID=2729538 RepID=UPI001CB8A027|nr:TetR-like C-terminal domain-containing protein [Paenibacillus sp. PL91]
MEGCKILADEFEKTPKSTDPSQYFYNIGETYSQFGQHYPSYYKLMFGGAFADFKPDEESMQGTVTAMRQLLMLFSSAQEQGLLPRQYDIEAVVSISWASLHGVIHLYFGGHLGDVQSANAVYKQTLALLVSSLLPDDNERGKSLV